MSTEATETIEAVEEISPEVAEVMGGLFGNSFEEESEEEPEEKTTETKETANNREEELLAKAEKEDLTPEEIKELQDAGYDVKSVDDNYIDTLSKKLEKGEDLTEEEISTLEKAGYKVEEVDDTPEWHPSEQTEVLYELYGKKPETAEEERELAQKAIQDYHKISSTFNGLMDNDPEFKQVLEKMLKDGIDFRSAAALYLGLEDIAPDPEDKEEYAKYMRLKVEKELQQEQAVTREKERKKNMKDSQGKILGFFEKNNLPKSQQDEVLRVMDDFITSFNEGRLDKYVDVIFKGLYADQTAKKAAEQAAVVERNRKYIIEKKKKAVAAPIKSKSVDQEPSTIPEGIKGMFQ